MTEHIPTPSTDPATGTDCAPVAPSAADDPPDRFGAPCPIAVGDKVTHFQDESVGGRVVYLYSEDGIAMCMLEEPSNPRAVAFPPWFLRRDGGDQLDFAQQMADLVSAQKATAACVLDRKQQEALSYSRELAGQLATVIDDLAGGRPLSVVPDGSLANCLEHALADLNEFHDLISSVGLHAEDKAPTTTPRTSCPEDPLGGAMPSSKAKATNDIDPHVRDCAPSDELPQATGPADTIMAKLRPRLAARRYCDTGLHAGEWRVLVGDMYLTDEEICTVQTAGLPTASAESTL